MEKVSAEVHHAGLSAASVVGDARQVSEAIGSHNEALAQSTAEFARMQEVVDVALGARRAALEQLFDNLEHRREDFENVLSSFNGLVDTAFTQAETRAREVGTFLSEATQSTVDTVEERFASVRAATGRERERTAAAMRAAYEQANEEMSRMLNDGTQRFSAAVTEMRDMGSDIRRELDATREEIRRGANDFPQDTAEQASAMRRVVASRFAH